MTLNEALNTEDKKQCGRQNDKQEMLNPSTCQAKNKRYRQSDRKARSFNSVTACEAQKTRHREFHG